MTAVRSENRLLCKWYQKPTASGRYLNYLSVQPAIYKKNVALNLARRAIGLTDQHFRQGAIERGKKFLVQNCYPSKVIDDVFSKVLREVSVTKREPSIKRVVDLTRIVSLPYVPLLSENLASILKCFGFTVAHSNYNNLSFLTSQLKSKRPLEQQCGVVYRLECKDCDIGYVGQTKQLLGKRIAGHKYNRQEKTALHYHEDNCGHRFNFDNPKVLGVEPRDFARGVLEMIHIVKDRDKLCNFRADVEGLGVAYHQFFQR